MLGSTVQSIEEGRKEGKKPGCKQVGAGGETRDEREGKVYVTATLSGLETAVVLRKRQGAEQEAAEIKMLSFT